MSTATGAPATRSFACCVLGAGPAGLGAALELIRHGVRDIVVVDRNARAGGLARTERFDGARFDVGPHRFYTKNREVDALWHRTLGEDFRPVRRLTRIYYGGRFYPYPLQPLATLRNLGVVASARALLSFARAQVRGGAEAETFEEWVTQRFGRRLYETFFRTYTEKVWGIPCREISSEWAAQRIRGLDLKEAVRHALAPRRRAEVRTLVDEFDYPVLGAGQMYEALCDEVAAAGGVVLLESRVTAIERTDGTVRAVEIVDRAGRRQRLSAGHFLTSIPLTRFVQLLRPAEPPPVLRAAEALFYRDHITVNLKIDAASLFPDQWIYVHAPDVHMARLANYNNFSPAMAGRAGKTALSVEYFVFQHDPLWRLADDDLVALATDELDRMRLVRRETVEAAVVVRETESYPTYYMGFREPYAVLKARLCDFDNVSPIGRGGLYKYDNQDHALYSGLLAARNHLGLPGAPYDVWAIPEGAEHLEEAPRAAR